MSLFDKTILAVDNQTLYVSTNAGESWKKAESVPDYIFKLAVFTDGVNIYVGGSKSVFISKDFGQTWGKVKDLNNSHVAGFLTIGDNTYTYGGSNYEKKSTLFVSKDKRQTWEKIPTKNIETAITALTSVESTLFIGTDVGLYRYDTTSSSFTKLKINDKDNNCKGYSLISNGNISAV